MRTDAQPGILAPLARAARYLVLDVPPDAPVAAVAGRLRELHIDEHLIAGIGAPFAAALRDTGLEVPGLRTFPALAGPGCAVPSTQGALLLHSRGEDHGDTLRTIQRALEILGPGMRVAEDVVGFRHLEGRDLTGYEDGTENPKGAAAAEVALAEGGGSYVAVQKWVHDLGGFEKLGRAEGDRVIGRARDTNEELSDAPPSAHVKRSAQESFDPTAFMWRRSMPYGTVMEHGLYFVAYGKTLDAFERVMRRMVGADDGVVDGLFRFSRPVSGGYYWCPPIAGAQLVF